MYSSTIDVICLFCLCSQLHPIEEKNLKVIPEEEIIGKGVFGTCKKMSYRGHAVAVKYFNKKMTPDAVQKEARMLNTFDHDGMFVFHFVIFQTISYQQRKFLPSRQVENCLQLIFRGILTLQHAQRQNLFIERKLSVIKIWNQIFKLRIN